VQPSSERELSGPRLPARLADLPHPPARLYLHGELPRGPAVAIVGTRQPTEPATDFARDLAMRLGEAGVTVLSGGALGIDSAAHQGALDAGGITVVVAPASFDRPFPPANAALFRRVLAQGGAYLTSAPPDTPAALHRFFERNAVLAALAHALVVVECPLRSGARNAAAAARRLGRALFAVPAVPWNTRGRGCVAELQRGARPLMSYRDLLRWLQQSRLHAVSLAASDGRSEGCLAGPSSDPDRSGALASADLSLPVGPGRRSVADGDRQLSFGRLLAPDQAMVLEAVQAGACHPDELCAATGLGPARVQELILTLTLSGLLATDRTGRLRVLR
jgi:DNA processing protein